MDAYEYMTRAAKRMDRDGILAAMADAVNQGSVPSLAGIHERMQHVEALAETYRGHDTWDQVYLLEQLMRCHERFRDWIGAYS
jgi:hypothetical protein